MNDLVSYKEKHNEANNENNCDGDNHNISDNYGVEGETDIESVNLIRTRQIKNMMATLLLSQGVPMIVSGDEVRRTQGGNNNAYCQDNETSWFDWNLVEHNSEMLRFVKGLIRFRREQPSVRRKTYLTGKPVDDRLIPDVSWFAPDGDALDWGQNALAMMAYIAAPQQTDDPDGFGRDLVMMFNSTGQQRQFIMPASANEARWNLFVDTAAEAPLDIFPELNGPVPPLHRKVDMPHHSFKVFVRQQQ